MMNFFLPFKGVFCRVQPIAFDGTLSFLELLNKLQYHMNDIIDNLNDLETALNEFEQYVETALDGKQDKLTWDETPTAGSTNPVYSKGIKTYVDDGLAGKQDVLTFDSVPTDGSTNPVESNGIYDALAGKQDTLTFDSVPTDGSSNPVESNGIYDALAGKQDTLTFDTTPTEYSDNPVTSDGIKTAMNAIAGRIPYMAVAAIDAQGNVTCLETYSNILNRLNLYSATTVVIATLSTGVKEVFYLDEITTNHINFINKNNTLEVDSTNAWHYNL